MSKNRIISRKEKHWIFWNSEILFQILLTRSFEWYFFNFVYWTAAFGKFFRFNIFHSIFWTLKSIHSFIYPLTRDESGNIGISTVIDDTAHWRFFFLITRQLKLHLLKTLNIRVFMYLLWFLGYSFSCDIILFWTWWFLFPFQLL